MKPRHKSAAVPKPRIQPSAPVQLHQCHTPKATSHPVEVDKVLLDLYRKIEEMRRKSMNEKSIGPSAVTDTGTGETDLKRLWEAKIDLISKEAGEIAEKWVGKDRQIERFQYEMREMLNRELWLGSKDRRLFESLEEHRQIELLNAKHVSYASESSKQISLLLYQNRLLDKTISELKERFALLPIHSCDKPESTNQRKPTQSGRMESVVKKTKKDKKRSSDLDRSRASLDALQDLSSTCQKYLTIERPFVKAVTDVSVTRAYKSLQTSLEQTQRCIGIIDQDGKPRVDSVSSSKQKHEKRPYSYPGSDWEDDRKEVRERLRLYQESETRVGLRTKNGPEFVSSMAPVLSRFTSYMGMKLQYMETALIAGQEKIDFLLAKLTGFRSVSHQSNARLIDHNAKLENEVKRLQEEFSSVQRLHNQEIQDLMQRQVSDLEGLRTHVETQEKHQIRDRENRLFPQWEIDRLKNELEESRRLVQEKEEALFRLKAAEQENVRKLDTLRKENEDFTRAKSNFLTQMEEISIEMGALQAEIQHVPVLQQEIASLQRTNRSLTCRLSDEKVAIEQEIAKIQAETQRIKEQKTDSGVRICRLHMAISDLEGTIQRSAEHITGSHPSLKNAKSEELKSDLFEQHKMQLEDIRGLVVREAQNHGAEVYELNIKIADLKEENSVLGSENSQYYKEKQDLNLDSLLQKCFPADTVQELDEVVTSLKDKWSQELDREQVFASEISTLRDENRQLREWVGMMSEDRPLPDRKLPNLSESEDAGKVITIVKDLYQHLIEELLLENIAVKQIIDTKNEGFRLQEDRAFRSEAPIRTVPESILGETGPPLSLMESKHSAVTQEFERLETALRKTLGSVTRLQGFIVRMKDKQGELIEGLRLDQQYALAMLDLSTKIAELKERKPNFSYLPQDENKAEIPLPDSPESPASLLDSDSSGFGRKLSEASLHDFRIENILPLSLNDSPFESTPRNNPEVVQNQEEKELTSLREKAKILTQIEVMVKPLMSESKDLIETLRLLIAQHLVQSEGQQSPPGSPRLMEIDSSGSGGRLSTGELGGKTTEMMLASPPVEIEKNRQRGNVEDLHMCRESIESGGAPTYRTHIKDAILKLISTIPNR